MAEELNINLTVKDLTEIVKGTIAKSIEQSLHLNKSDIDKQINEYFKAGHFFNRKDSQFESALNWAVENAFQEGLNKAMNELGFREMIAEKAKEILSNPDFIKDLAEKKVRASLGL